MRKFAILLLTILLTTVALAQIRSAPLLALREARAGYENMIWMEQRTKIGDTSVTGYIQGTGGADDALMGFIFENEWDMLTATIGFKSTAPEGRKAEFIVEAGNKQIFNSGVMESKGPCQQIRVPIRGHKRILLRILSDRYNSTAGAAWGEPTLFSGLSEEDLKNDWNLSINKKKVPLAGNSAPSEVLIPFPVPFDKEKEYTVKIRRDSESRTVIVEREEENL